MKSIRAHERQLVDKNAIIVSLCCLAVCHLKLTYILISSDATFQDDHKC